MWRKLKPLTETELAAVADMLAAVGQLLQSKRGVADSGALIRLHHRLVLLLGLPMPAPAMPTARELRDQRHQFLSDAEIDAAQERLEAALNVYNNGRVRAEVLDAHLKLTRKLWPCAGARDGQSADAIGR
jgi:hypothetical protein